MSDTPRTEEALIDNSYLCDEGFGKSEYVHADFARSLERELAVAKAGLNGSKTRCQAFEEMLKEATDQRDTLQQQLAECREDKERLDWLESKFGKWHQGDVLHLMNDEWRCSSGFHRGRTAREAIDNARAILTATEPKT